jgi:hypothetical protein
VIARSAPAGGSAQHRRRPIAIALAALIVCNGATLAIGSQLFGWFNSSGWFSVESRKSEAPVTQGELAYIVERTLYRPGKRPQLLARPVLSAIPLNVSDNALAVSSPDGRYVLYQTRRSVGGPQVPSYSPVLYVHDTVSRREKVLARGAETAAWSRDGRIAYFKGDREPYIAGRSGADNGQVVVQTLNGAPSKWTRRSNGYDVLAWAGDELLVEIRDCYLSSPGCREQPGPGVYALNRSGRLRPLNLARLIALSPDGRYAFGVADRPMNGEQLSSRVRISRVDTGEVITTLSLARPLKALDSLSFADTASLSSFSYGSWRGNSIVMTSSPALVFLKQRGRQLVVKSMINIEQVAYVNWLDVPLFTGPGNDRVALAVHALAPEGGIGRQPVLSCSRSTRSCVRVAYLPRDRSTGTFTVVANPSRP